jgi:hypothetical protein
MSIYMGIKLVPWSKLGLGRPTCLAGQLTWVAGRPSFANLA